MSDERITDIPIRITGIPIPNECKNCIFSAFKQFQPKWIPVKERLPIVTYDEYGNHSSDPVIICMESGEVEIGWYNPAGLFEQWDGDGYSIIGSLHDGAVDYLHVVAWMPFPEPYREETEDAEIH